MAAESSNRVVAEGQALPRAPAAAPPLGASSVAGKVGTVLPSSVHPAMHSTEQHDTYHSQHSKAQHSTAQRSAAQRSATQRSAAQNLQLTCAIRSSASLAQRNEASTPGPLGGDTS